MSESLVAEKVVVYGQPSFKLACDAVEAYVTELGGHLAPVEFRLPGATVQPFAIAPWAEEDLGAEVPAYQRVLRGDFFCLPFGMSSPPFRDEEYPLHGETANEIWTLEGTESAEGRCVLKMRLEMLRWPGVVTKEISVVKGQPAVYQSHVISGVSGPMCFGTHPMLQFPQKAGSGLLSLSEFEFGQVYPGDFEEPAQGGYSYLKPSAEFTDLRQVPTAVGGVTDLTRYPSHSGYSDLVQVLSNRGATRAWSAVSFPEQGFVWFSLKDPRVLNGTVLWLSNGGRHYAPWNGRHVAVLGVEELTGYFGFGMPESATENPFVRKGFATTVTMHPEKPTVVRTVMGVAPIDIQFGHVVAIEPTKSGVEIVSENGSKVDVEVDTKFVWPD